MYSLEDIINFEKYLYKKLTNEKSKNVLEDVTQMRISLRKPTKYYKNEIQN